MPPMSPTGYSRHQIIGFHARLCYKMSLQRFVVQLTHVWNNWRWLKFRHDSPDSQPSLWTHFCMFTYAVMSFTSTDGTDREEAFSGFAGVADEM